MQTLSWQAGDRYLTKDGTVMEIYVRFMSGHPSWLLAKTKAAGVEVHSFKMGWTSKDLDAHYARIGRETPSELVRKAAEKYGRKKVKTVDGKRFDSSLEAKAYQVLKLWEMCGRIGNLKLQPEFLLQDGFRDERGKWHRPVRYIADFSFSGNTIDDLGAEYAVVDVKGFQTPAFRIKEKLFRAKFPNLDLQIWDTKKVKELIRI